MFPTKTGFEVVQSNSIVYCKSDGAYSSVYTIEKEYFTSKPFKEIEEILEGNNFIRVHRSYLINKNFIKSFKSEDYKLEMITGELIPVSDSLFTKKKLINVITG